MGFVLIPPDLPNLPVAPSPLPASEPEKTHHLSNGSQRGEGEVKTLSPDSLIWHPDFGGAWRRVGEVFP